MVIILEGVAGSFKADSFSIFYIIFFFATSVNKDIYDDNTYSKYNKVGKPVILKCCRTTAFSGLFTSIAASTFKIINQQYKILKKY